MKKKSIYESPVLSYAGLDLSSGLLKSSGIVEETDRWVSVDGGVVRMDDDAEVVTLP